MVVKCLELRAPVATESEEVMGGGGGAEDVVCLQREVINGGAGGARVTIMVTVPLRAVEYH